uniref:nudix hydrolase 15, mitochondrial-like n=1 Tax=Erigeron canadensis TaxID=72917 RepID=UPI001CB8FBDA|nr:nudix hydrolase 15, mitochondrial-like [Erigeron canadensis]
MLLRKLSSSSSSSIISSRGVSISTIITSSISKFNNNNNNVASVNSHGRLAQQQLRLYKPTPTIDDGDITTTNQVGFQESANNQENITPTTISNNNNRAAVLICLFQQEHSDGLRVILTKRSSGLSTHSGEVSLPGGKTEEGDVDDAATAIREAQEEIGLNPSLVNVVAVLKPFLTKHLLTVIPVIGILSDRSAFNPTPNITEVEDVFDAPLEMFLKDENRRSEEIEWLGSKILIHYFDYEVGGKKFMIWGLTAGILIRAAAIVYKRSPAFLEQIPNFKLPKVLSKDNKLP